MNNEELAIGDKIFGRNGREAHRLGLKKYLEDLAEKEKPNPTYQNIGGIMNVGNENDNSGQSVESRFLKDIASANIPQTANAPAQKERNIKSFWFNTISATIAAILGGLFVWWWSKHH